MGRQPRRDRKGQKPAPRLLPQLFKGPDELARVSWHRMAAVRRRGAAWPRLEEVGDRRPEDGLTREAAPCIA
jgi:hypothetical protein